MSSPLNLWRRAEQLKLAALDPTKSSNEVWINRQFLQEIYQSLLIADLEFSLDKKVEQDLWNYAFKKQITSLQNQSRDKQNQRRAEVHGSLNLFLDAASGFYIQLLQELCSAFSLDLPFRGKHRNLGVIREYQTSTNKAKWPCKSSSLYLCQDCLVHLGDIARYRLSNEQAQAFYKLAVQLAPMNGQPYNQLAILEVQKGNKLSTIFYHTRSLAVKHPFPVAEININKFYAKISKDGQDGRQKVATNEWLSMYLQFLASIHLELDPMKSRIRLDRILLSFKPNLSSPGFTTSQLLQTVTILFFEHFSLVGKRVKNPSRGHTYIGSSAREAGDIEARNFATADDDDEEDEFAEEDGGGKINKRGGVLSEVRLSEREWQEVYKKRVSMVLELAGTMLESIFMAANEKEGELWKLLLPVVKVTLDWVVSDKDTINSPIILKSGLWTTLCPLANSLITELDKINLGQEFLESKKNAPLPEDRDLQCFLPLNKALCNLDFSSRGQELSDDEECCLRLHRILTSCVAMERLCERSEGKSAGVLVAKYSSGPQKVLISFETHISKNRPDISSSSSTSAASERRPARLNVAMQTILQKSAPELRPDEIPVPDADGALKQSLKRSLKVEFKEMVDDAWKERDSNESRGISADEDHLELQQQFAGTNNNNNPQCTISQRHPQNFQRHPMPFTSLPHPHSYFGAYPYYPLPPPPPLPFAFRPGCPLPAPPSMMPRFPPMSSPSATSMSSNPCGTGGKIDAFLKFKGKDERESDLKIPLTLEEEFPSLPSKKINCSVSVSTSRPSGSPRPVASPTLLSGPRAPKKTEIIPPHDETSGQARGPPHFMFPTFQPMHPPAFPRTMLPPPPPPYAPQRHVQPPPTRLAYVGPMMPSSFAGYPGGVEQIRSFYQQQPQNAQTFENQGTAQVYPFPSGQNLNSFQSAKPGVMQAAGCEGFPNSQSHPGVFPPVVHEGLGIPTRNGSQNSNESLSNPCRGDLSLYGPLATHSYPQLPLLAPHNAGSQGQLAAQPSPYGHYQPNFQTGQPRLDIGRLCINQSQMHLPPNDAQTDTKCHQFGAMQNHLSASQSDPRAPPLELPRPPAGWSVRNQITEASEAEKLQDATIDVRLCGQRAKSKVSGIPNNYNNSGFENVGDDGGKPPFSYSLFSRSPWHPALVTSSYSSSNVAGRSTNRNDRMMEGEHFLDESSPANDDGASWHEMPPGRISIMKSTNNTVTNSNVLESTAWPGQQTPLEKLLQQQKQLKPGGC